VRHWQQVLLAAVVCICCIDLLCINVTYGDVSSLLFLVLSFLFLSIT